LNVIFVKPGGHVTPVEGSVRYKVFNGADAVT
jgi:hypothetical protein